jgi:hypothetical protein
MSAAAHGVLTKVRFRPKLATCVDCTVINYQTIVFLFMLTDVMLLFAGCYRITPRYVIYKILLFMRVLTVIVCPEPAAVSKPTSIETSEECLCTSAT